jgi:ATP-independent RNA helicase DbpA
VNAPDFSALGLAPGLFENLRALGYETMTPIQAQSLPSIMAGKDVIAQGSTGTGKTAAFGLGLLSRIDAKLFRVQAMVLCPTRELADQVANEIRALARSIPNIKVLTLCGGTPLAPQASSLQHGVHVVVGTPGRIEDHLQRETLPLQAVHTLILDEADRMLDMGFQEAIDAIIRQVPGRRQTLLFSATYPPQIQAIARRIMLDPVMVRTQARGDNPDIEQHFFALGGDRERLSALCRILLHYQPDSALVFCNTIKATRELCAALVEFGFHALALHGDLEQRERDETLIQFANKSISILVATDVAARGLDIDTLDAVVNYEIARDPDVYLHRIGRTGRAGSKGQAYALYTDKEMASLALIPGDIDPLADAG